MSESTLKSAFVIDNPPGCTRQCHKLHEFHNKSVSIALYSPHVEDYSITQKICVYGFSCGVEVYAQLDVEPTETVYQTMRKAIYDVLPKLSNLAEQEFKELRKQDIN